MRKSESEWGENQFTDNKIINHALVPAKAPHTHTYTQPKDTQTPSTLSLAINRAVQRAMIDACPSSTGKMTKQFSVAGANIEKMLVKWKMLWEIMIRQFDLARLLIKHHRLPLLPALPIWLRSFCGIMVNKKHSSLKPWQICCSSWIIHM